MVMHYPSLKDPLLSRRQALSRMGAGFGGLGLATLLAESAQAETSPLTVKAVSYTHLTLPTILLV